MPVLKLILATQENGLMQAVIAEWDKQLSAQKMPKSALESVRTYEAQLRPDKTYGVYVLCNIAGDDVPKSPFEAFVHVNHAFSKTPKPILRLTWSRIAPRYEWENPVENHARIFASLIGDALRLSRADFKSDELKIYLYSNADRSYGRNFALALKQTETLTSNKLPFKVATRGSWLHFNWL